MNQIQRDDPIDRYERIILILAFDLDAMQLVTVILPLWVLVPGELLGPPPAPAPTNKEGIFLQS